MCCRAKEKKKSQNNQTNKKPESAELQTETQKGLGEKQSTPEALGERAENGLGRWGGVGCGGWVCVQGQAGAAGKQQHMTLRQSDRSGHGAGGAASSLCCPWASRPCPTSLPPHPLSQHRCLPVGPQETQIESEAAKKEPLLFLIRLGLSECLF